MKCFLGLTFVAAAAVAFVADAFTAIGRAIEDAAEELP